MKKIKNAFIQEKKIYSILILIGIISVISFSFVAVTDTFSLYDKNIDLKINSSYKISIKGRYPTRDYHYSIENPDIAEIDKNGTIKAKKIGETKVIIKSKHNLFSNEINLNISDFTITSLAFEQDTINMIKGKKITLDPIFNNDVQVKHDLIWSSSDETIATVNEYGVVTSIDDGTAVITAKEEDSKLEAKVNINVGVPKKINDTSNLIASIDEEPVEDTEEDSYEIEGIVLNANNLKMYVGDIKKVSATIMPLESNKAKLKYESSDTSIATISKDGIIVAKGKGTCNIFVSSEDDKVSTSLVVHVTGNKIPVKDITFKDKSISLDINENYILSPIITPTNASIQDVTYSSSNDEIVTVDENGKIHALKNGHATIVAVTKDGHLVSSVNVKVSNNKVEKNKIIESNIVGIRPSMVSGDKIKLNIDLKNSNGNNVKYIITSSNKDVIRVNQNGVVYAIDYGIAYIDVDTVDGSFKKRYFITVLPGKISPEYISLSKNKVQLIKGGTVEIKANVIPDNAANKVVEFKSSNENIATVNSNGVIKANGVGSCNVVATIKGTGIKRSIKVSVVNKENIIDLRKQKIYTYHSSVRVYDEGTNFMRAMQNFAIYKQGTKNERLIISMPSRTLVKKGIKLTGALKKDLMRTNIVLIPNSELVKPSSKKRKYMYLNYSGHGQALDLQPNGIIWTNGSGFLSKDSNGSYWGESKALLNVKFKSNKDNDSYKAYKKIFIKDSSTKKWLTNLEISFDWDNNLAAARSGKKVFIYNAKQFIQGKLKLLYSFELNTRTIDGKSYSRQGHAISNGYYYQYRGIAGSKMYVEVYNYVGELQYSYVFNPKLSGQEAEGLKIYNNKIFVGVVYNCKGCNGKTNAIYYFK